MIKLFIGGFPLDMTEMELVQIIAPYADVLTIKLVRDRATKKCKGYGFIEVADETHAYQAIGQLNGMLVGDRELSLNIVPEATPVHRKAAPLDATARPKRPRRPRL
ncbi:RNA recognition motif domain-containing protein [Mucilaginibacter segetis]|uniref:RNA-binding protein n=1 Tax=Mucilaginibacter segetis TaxID=2793071 RepID=A0A934UMB4_9SPHI|nr:RNA-binding protein [Mucilaginibacter segetis]MBK0379224.1 RNA-binding protein [Mucilaginibacter segetis]